MLGPKSPGTPAVRPAKHGPGNKQVGSKFSKPRASCVTTLQRPPPLPEQRPPVTSPTLTDASGVRLGTA